MPTFRGVVSEDEIIAITEYIKHLSPQEANPLNNRSTPTEIRDSEVPNIQQQNQQQPVQQTPQGRGLRIHLGRNHEYRNSDH